MFRLYIPMTNFFLKRVTIVIIIIRVIKMYFKIWNKFYGRKGKFGAKEDGIFILTIKFWSNYLQEISANRSLI